MDLDRWRDTEISHHLTCMMVDPHSFEPLDELYVTDASIDEEYESDTRVSGSVTAEDYSSYIDLSAIRLYHDARFSDGSTDKELLGTFFVHGVDPSYKSGSTSASLTLGSALWAMSVDMQMYSYTVPTGTRTSTVFVDLCNRCWRPHKLLPGYNNYRFTTTQVWDAGQSHLSHIYNLTDISGNRVDVEPDGTITLGKYTAPHYQAAADDLAWDDPLVLSESIDMESDDGEVPGRVGVSWEYRPDGATDSRTIAAFADVSQGSRYSINRRGYRVSELKTLQDVDSSSVAEAQKRAKAYLSEVDQASVKWSLTVRWCEIHEGDVLNWMPPTGTWRKCLVYSADMDLKTWTIKLTLKEV